MAHAERKNKSDTSNNSGKWNHLKIIQKIGAAYKESTKSKNYRQQPYRALRRYSGKY